MKIEQRTTQSMQVAHKSMHKRITITDTTRNRRTQIQIKNREKNVLKFESECNNDSYVNKRMWSDFILLQMNS